MQIKSNFPYQLPRTNKNLFPITLMYIFLKEVHKKLSKSKTVIFKN